MKVTQMIAGALVAALSLATMPLSAAQHLVSATEVRQQLTDREQTRQQNAAQLRGFLSSPQAQQTLAKAGMDASEVLAAVTSLDDSALESLSARAVDAQQNLSAGALSNQQLTYIIIALGTAVLILVILAA